MKKCLILSIAITALITGIQTNRINAQGAAINNSGASADSSAILDVNANDKGVLIPRMTAAEKSAISSPATSLMIYQTDGAAGFYFNAGAPATPNWVLLNADNLGNHTATDSLNMSNKKIVNVATCTQNLDAANKLYVDNTVAAGGGGGGGHYLGEAYEGGKIFFIDGAGTHGLIARTVDDMDSIKWSNVSSTLIGYSAQYVNDGQKNITAIINQPGHTTSAAKVCDTLTTYDGGTPYSDWYLPAINELKILWENQQYVGDFSNFYYYWSSTEAYYSNAYMISFINWGGYDYFESTSKNQWDWLGVRCIRKF